MSAEVITRRAPIPTTPARMRRTDPMAPRLPRQHREALRAMATGVRGVWPIARSVGLVIVVEDLFGVTSLRTVDASEIRGIVEPGAGDLGMRQPMPPRAVRVIVGVDRSWVGTWSLSAPAPARLDS